MDVRPGYKQTEVGVIPEEWQVVPVGRLLRSTPSYGINAPAISFDSRFPMYLRITDITEDGKFAEANKMSVKHPAAGLYSLESGDIVFARTGATVGKSYLYDSKDGRLVYAGFLIRVSPDPERLVPKLLSFYAQSCPYRNWVKVNSVRSGQPGINGRQYASLPIPLPPTLAEQEAIAEALSDADALIESLEQLLAKKRQIKTGAMQELLTGKKRLPGFSGEWEVKRLGEVSEIVMGQSPSSAHYNNKGEGLPLIQGNADIYGRQTIRRVFTTEVTKRGQPGDILMSVRAPVGEISRAVFDVCLGRGVCAIRYSENNFLYYALIAREQDWAKLSKGSTFDSVSSMDVKKFEIVQPTDETEQIAIATTLSDMDAEIAALEAKLSKARQLKQGMMQELLTGRIRLV